MRFKTLIVAAVIIALMSCKSDYQRKVDSELAKNIRQDTLFIGLRFGMTPREFFAYCWELNQTGLVSESHSNTGALYKLARFGKRYDLNFYPTFIDNKIAGLPVDYSYQVFAPWNPKYSLDTLFKEVVRMQKELYGDGFLTVSDPKRGTALVRVDGNRRLSIFQNIEKNCVTVLFKDLTVEIDKTE